MPRYSIKTTPKKAFKFIKMVKSIKNKKKFEVDTVPATKVQKEILDDLMGGFFTSIKNIKDGLNES